MTSPRLEPPDTDDTPDALSAIDERFPWTRISNVALGAAVVFACLALARYRTYHNETFDLAFYARLTWGIGHGDYYNPLVGAKLWGLHLSWVLLPLGLLARFVATVPLLLVVQAAAVAAAGIPLARVAARRVGHPLAADAALAVWLLYPAVGSVASYEFHPSALALLPLALSLDYLDRRLLRPGLVALAAAVACREDVALIAALLGVAIAFRKEHRVAGALTALAATAYFALFFFVIAPRYMPRHGSLQLHFGHLGATPMDVLKALLTRPVETLRELATPVRLLYVPRLLVPVAFTALLRPRWLLPALAPVAINLLSQFPTAVQVHSHYASLVIPFIVVAAAHGVGRLVATGGVHGERYALAALVAVALGTAHMHHRAGMTPLSRRFDRAAHVPDERLTTLDAVVAAIPPDAVVSAPDHLLPHLAERPRLYRFPPPGRVEYMVLSTEHRSHFLGTQDIWRNEEEALVRNTLFRRRYGVYRVYGSYIVLRRDHPLRAWARDRYVDFGIDPHVHAAHADVGASLAVAGWGAAPLAHGTRVTLLLAAHRPWPLDLGFELGWGPMVPHAERSDPEHTWAFLPFDGVFQPAFVRPGEVVRTQADVPATLDELRAHGLWFGARRLDGSRLDAKSLHWTPLPP